MEYLRETFRSGDRLFHLVNKGLIVYDSTPEALEKDDDIKEMYMGISE